MYFIYAMFYIKPDLLYIEFSKYIIQIYQHILDRN